MHQEWHQELFRGPVLADEMHVTWVHDDLILIAGIAADVAPLGDLAALRWGGLTVFRWPPYHFGQDETGGTVMKKRFNAIWLASGAVLAVAAVPAVAGTKYQTSLVPIMAGTMPGFSASGSKIKLDDQLRLKGKIKKVVDGTGARVTTDGVPSADDYSIEVDLGLASGSAAGTVTVPFDLTNGNGGFSADLTGDPALAGGGSGDGVAVTGVRVKDSMGTLLGVGGFAIK